MSTLQIIDFYNSGAQVQIPAAAAGNMTHSFTGGGGADADAEPTEVGYEPRANSKLAEGAAYDELEHGGQRLLLLKGGHVYAVKVGEGELHVISAEEGHLSLPIPASAEVEVEEYDEDKHAVSDEGDDEDAAVEGEDTADEEE